VPRTVAHGLAEGAGGALFWCAETWHPGEPFDHARAGLPEARAGIHDLARQLRRLHAVELDAFGDLPPRPYEVYATAAEWVANKRRRVAAAMRLVGADAALASHTERGFDQIAGLYDGRPRLCKGDCAGDNLLVAGDHVTIVDWEWAQGLDPAADLAYWCRATPDPAARALLLAAYEPDDPPAFHRRVQAYAIIHAVETIHVLDEHRHAFGADERAARLRAERQALERALAHWAE
jgi:aminoglycoside phosphotransferase (APT) family kinase protein